MKIFKKFLFPAAVFCLGLIFAGCSDGTTGLFGNGDNDSSVNSRDWKWYEYKEGGYTIYSHSGTEVSGITMHSGVQLPFFNPDSAAGKDLYRPNREDADMYPEDGWVLVKVDFGTVKEAPNVPYFILYNKARAILRFVFYYPRGNVDYTYAIVGLEQTTGKSSMLSYFDSLKCFADDFNDDKTLASIVPMTIDNWSYADFVISYDPNVTTDAQKDSTFYLSIYGVDESNVSLYGKMTLNQAKGANHLFASGKKSASEVISSGSEGISYYNSTGSFQDYVNNSSGDWYSDLFKNVSTGASVGASIGGYYGAIIGAAAGVVKTMVTAFKGSSNVPVNYTGEIVMDGSITKTNLLYSIALNVPGAQTDSDYPESLSYYEKPLGVFSIKSKPVIDITIQTVETKLLIGAGYICKASSIKMHNNTFPEIVLNNIDGYYVDSIELGYVFSNNSVSQAYIDTAFGLCYTDDYLTTIWQYFNRTAYYYHKDKVVTFNKLQNFINSDFNYTENAVIGTAKYSMDNSYGYKSGDTVTRQWVIESYSIGTDLQAIARLITPEIAVKVTLYSVNDAEKKNPVIHLKRVRADFNLYRSNYQVVSSKINCDFMGYNCVTEDTYGWVTTDLGLFTN